jgi:hypothetical protein
MTRERVSFRSPGRAPGVLAGAPAVSLIIAGCAVVALAAAGVRLLLPAAGLAGAWGPVVRVAGVAAAAAGFWGLMAQRGRLMQPGRRAPDPTAAGLVAAGTTMAILAALALLAPRQRVIVPSADRMGDVATAQSEPPETPPPGASSRNRNGGFFSGFGLGLLRGRRLRTGARGAATPQNPEPQSPAWSLLRNARWVLVGLLLLAAALIAFRQLRRGGLDDELDDEPPEPEPEPTVAAEDAAAGLAASLDALAAPGRDPRQQITAAYRRLLLALAAAGAPRQPQEAPYEHLDRALGPLRVEPGPMHRLTELYVTAQFSEHPVTESHRAAAAEALAVSLDGLRVNP